MNRKYSKLFYLMINHVRNISEYNDPQNCPLTPQNIIFMIFKSQMSILCVKTRDILADGQGCDREVNHEKCFLCFPNKKFTPFFSGHNIDTSCVD